MDAHVSRRLDSCDRAVKVLGGDDKAAGHDPIAHDFARSVHVGQETFEREDTLADPAFDDQPFCGGNDARHEIEWKWSFLLSREREGHASIGKHAISHTASLFEIGARERLDLLEQGPVVGAGTITRFEHLVPAGVGSVAVEQIAHDCRSSQARCYVPMSRRRRFGAAAPRSGHERGQGAP